MKKFFPLLLLLFVTQSSWAQVGTGVVLQTEDSYTFSPTTVDSISTFTLQVQNDVGVTQTVFLGGLDSPFSLDNLGPIELEAGESSDLTISFLPNAVGTFSDTLEVIGSVFGTAELVLQGDGIQVALSWSPDTLSFNTTPIGQVDSQIVTVLNVGDGDAALDNFSFSNPAFSIDLVNSDTEIEEGQSGSLLFVFEPTGAGTFTETVTFETNDPNNPTVTLSLEAISVSEVSGDVCNVTWLNADSPFTLVGDITVPDSCELTIEEGVQIVMDGYKLLVEGELNLLGTPENPVFIENGFISYSSGTPSELKNVVFTTAELDIVEEGNFFDNGDHLLVYENDFENSNQQYDFDCFSYRENHYATGSSTDYGSYGCNDFYRTSSSSWSLQSNSGDHYLRFYSSNGGDGYLYLDEEQIAPETGYYEFSFTYESDRYEQGCFMTIDQEVDGYWRNLYKSPSDIEGNSTFTRLARAIAFFNAGEAMNFRIKHHNNVSDSYQNDMYTYIDEVRIEKLRLKENYVRWDFENNAANFASVGYGSHGNEPQIHLKGDTLRINSYEDNINFNTTSWSEAPIVVPASGWYYIMMDNRLISSSWNTTQYVEYRNSTSVGTWYRVVDNPTKYQQSAGSESYDWRDDVVHSVNYFNEGDRIDFKFYGNHWTTEGQTDWEVREISIFQLNESSGNVELDVEAPVSYYGVNTNRDLDIANAEIPNVISGHSSQELVVENSSLGRLSVASDSAFISLQASQTENLHITGENVEMQIQAGAHEDILTMSGSLEVEEAQINELAMGNPLVPPGAGEVLYYNSFDSDQQYDFDCYDYDSNHFATGTSTSYGSYGCNSFGRGSSSSWSFQGEDDDYYLNWASSTGGDGYLFLDQTITAPTDGVYEFSFTYESDRYEYGCFMTIDVFKDGTWKTVFTSPMDIEGNSNFRRLARAKNYFSEGEEIKYRIKHHNNVNTGDANEMYTYIDEVLICKEQSESQVVEWDLQANLNDFNNVTGDYGYHGEDRRVKLYGDTLRLNSYESTINFETSNWQNAPIIVPEDGWYFIEVDNRLNSATNNTSQYVQYRTSVNSTWYYLIENRQQYGTAHGAQPYSWRKDVVSAVDFFEAGTRLDFKFYGNYWTTEGQTDWELRGIRIFKFGDSGAGDVDGSASVSISESNVGTISSSYSTVATIENSVISNSEYNGIHLFGSQNDISMSHTEVFGHNGDGVKIEGENNAVSISNCLITQNSGNGLRSENSSHSVNYVTVADNGGQGISSSNPGPSDINNSVLSNNSSAYSVSGVLTQYNYTGSYPQFVNGSYHLQPYSPCVDAAMPWHTDEHMPFGIGGLRADMGAYGGPNNAGWGGSPAPSAAPSLTSVMDSPQDQGNRVGLSFDASAFDDAIIPDNITHYAFWRHFDPTGQTIESVEVGNWELLDDMPAQGFAGYAYQAQTLGNTNAFGTFNSCYTVVAHTDDPDTYWYSNVMCGESVDNLAPVEPELGGMVLETGGVTVFWDTPQEADYAYTEITSDAGFVAEVNSDTLTVDLTAEPGLTYTYTAVHYDVNGNGSEPSSVTLEVEAGIDVIELNAGWNLISTDRAVDQNVGEVFAGLSEGNLQYVTGFEGGVQFYDPSGLSFLNTLSTLTPGHGYWVKVEADDVLEVSGTRLDEAYTPALLEGWNLVGYAAEDPAAPGDFFADLEAEGDLLYVTGFDQGVQVYDPNGLSFLNTLTEMRNGFGYWVKSAVATEGDVLAPLSDDVLPASKPSPRYDVVNGTSTLGDHAGEFVDVLDGWGTVVARLPILEGGHLMTTALFGDDPATGIVEGLAEGEVLHFGFRGSMANETLVFGGNMAHKTLALTFDELEAGLSVFPNPAVDMTTVRVHAVEAGLATLEVTDVQGRVVLRHDLSLAVGVHAVTLDVDALEGGAYNVELRQGITPLGTSRLVVLD